MEKIINQTLYKCEYCGKRLLTKQGARLHEHEYCKNINSPNQRRIIEFKEQCEHKQTSEVWAYIPSECVKEPLHTECCFCGKIL